MGKKGHGKDTVADIVSSLVMDEYERDEYTSFLEEWTTVHKIAFAGPMKSFIKDVFGWTDEHVNGSIEMKEKGDMAFPRYADIAKKSPRKEIAKIINFYEPDQRRADTIVTEIMGVIQNHPAMLPVGPPILTPRFAMQTLGTQWGRHCYDDVWIDLAMRRVEQAGDTDIVVISDVRFLNEAQAIRDAGGVIWSVYRPEIESSDSHRSETESDMIKPDIVINNNGTLDQLREAVLSALYDIPQEAPSQSELTEMNGMIQYLGYKR